MRDKKLYGNRNPIELDIAGNYFSKHMGAMTGEGLYGKAEIAEELGHRDMIIAELAESLENVLKVVNCFEMSSCPHVNENGGCGGEDEDCDWLVNSREAIAKAYGETPCK